MFFCSRENLSLVTIINGIKWEVNRNYVYFRFFNKSRNQPLCKYKFILFCTTLAAKSWGFPHHFYEWKTSHAPTWPSQYLDTTSPSITDKNWFAAYTQIGFAIYPAQGEKMISTGIIISVRSIPRLLRTNSLSHDSTFHAYRNLSKIVL